MYVGTVLFTAATIALVKFPGRHAVIPVPNEIALVPSRETRSRPQTASLVFPPSWSNPRNVRSAYDPDFTATAAAWRNVNASGCAQLTITFPANPFPKRCSLNKETTARPAFVSVDSPMEPYTLLSMTSRARFGCNASAESSKAADAEAPQSHPIGAHVSGRPTLRSGEARQ